eukprot:TRINITY_DN1551_c0_g1_i9.p1 TRINITY_DN1551_c0_g1~~TRINITY_DN1551_c0_g1_i9.p1  ORF type:complete len:273 (-),score=36.38 TRINITY_DN1551_c0_g1_i9:35-853(-)
MIAIANKFVVTCFTSCIILTILNNSLHILAQQHDFKEGVFQGLKGLVQQQQLQRQWHNKQQLGHTTRKMLQDERDNEIIEGVSEQICLGAGDFSAALLDLCIVSDLAEFVSLPSTYRTACCNLVQQYFSNECKGTCVSQDAMQQTNVWLMVCRVNLPPLEVCTDEQLVLSAPMAEDAILPALKAVQEAQEVLQEAQQEEQEQNGDKEKEMDDEEQQQSSPSPQLQKDPVVIVSSDETQDSLNSLALDNVSMPGSSMLDKKRTERQMKNKNKR